MDNSTNLNVGDALVAELNSPAAEAEGCLDTGPAVLSELATRAFEVAQSAKPDGQVELLSRAVSSGPRPFVFTMWPNGVFNTLGGIPMQMSTEQLACELLRYGKQVVKKGEGAWIAGARTNGGARDRDVVTIEMLSLDSDKAGDWDGGLRKLKEAGVGFVAQRSSSHRPWRPKFHLHVSFLYGWSGSKAEWRQVFRWFLGWFNGFFGFEFPATFDVATDRLAQPFFLSTRREPADPVPEVQWYPGGALDGQLLLEETGFVHAFKKPLSRRRRSKVHNGAPAATSTGAPQGLVARVFVLARMAGRMTSKGALCVQCPWENEHTSGARFDSSTVVFPPRTPGDQGKFYCSHEHCREAGRSQLHVLAALPSAALAAAIREDMRRA